MNIDSSSLLSLLSSDKSLENIQQAIRVDNGAPQPFADTFLEKIRQINSSNNEGYFAENFTINDSENTEKLHELAGWLNEESSVAVFSRFFGKELPKTNILENDIDLENTLESLVNVMLALEEVEFNSVEIQTKLSTVLEEIEAIDTDDLGRIELEEKLGKLVNELQEIKQDFLKNFEIKIASHLQEIGQEVDVNSTKLTHGSLDGSASNLIDESNLVVSKKPDPETSEKRGFTKENFTSIKVQKELNIKKQGVVNSDSLTNAISDIIDQQLQENGFFMSDKLATRIDTVVASIEQIQKTLSEDEAFVNLESQLESLVTDVNFIKQVLYQNPPVKLVDSTSKNNINIQFDKTGIRKEDDESIQLANQMSAIATTLIEPLKQEKLGAESTLVGQFIQAVKPEINKEMLSLKQMAEERLLTVATKEQTETLLQQENMDQNKSVATAIKSAKVELLWNKDINQSFENGAVNFISDFSNSSKAIMLENKVDIPSMHKHFAHPEWNKEFGERVIWMLKQATPSAELRLNPKHLGPITIKLDVTQDQVSVAFSAQHTAVKEAVEAAIPKLREMFSVQQLNLVDVNVSQENLDQRHSRGYPQMWGEQRKSDGQDAENLEEKEQDTNTLEIVDEIESGRAIANNGILSLFA